MKTPNPKFTAPSRPFKQLSSTDAIAWPNEHGILHETEGADGNEIKDVDGKPVMVPYAIADNTTEATERQMTDIIGTPVSPYGFPAELKAFYTKKIPSKESETALCVQRAVTSSYRVSAKL